MTDHDRRSFLRTIGIGTTGAFGSAYVTESASAATTITVEGAGEDIWDAADEFHYYYAEVTGDFDVTVRIDSQEDTNDWAKAGLMVRQTLNADAETAMIRKTPGHDTSFQWRSDDGQQMVSTTSDGGSGESEVSNGTVSATWQRLVRSGDTIEAYGSFDGSNWTLIADISPGEIDFAEDAYVGLAVCSASEGTLSAVEFSNLSGLSVSINQDVGSVEVAGSVSESTTDPDLTVSTGSASGVDSSSATLSGSLDDLGGASSADVSFEYRQTGASAWSATAAQTLSSAGSFSDTVTDLSSATDYEFRAVAAASDGDSATASTNAFTTSSTGGSGAITVDGAGADVWNAADECHYYYASVSGDFDVTVRVDSLEDTDDYAKAGLMVRETLNADAVNAMVRRTPGHDTAAQWRASAGGESESTTSNEGESESEISGGTMVADYQRLVRSGDVIELYGSSDGSNWTLVADLDSSVVDFSDPVYVGLAVTSHNAGTLCTAEFSELSGLSPTGNQDVGSVDVAGSVSDDGGSTDPAPVVTTGSASNVTATSATLDGSLNDLGEASSADVSFQYRESGTSTWSSTAPETLSSTGSFDADVSGLTEGADYEFRAVANASDGDSDAGSIATFTLSSDAPAVSTGTVSNVGTSSATLDGSLDSLGGASSADVSFEWRDASDSDWNETAPETLSSTGPFDADVSGLSSGTSYEFRAAASASDGDSATGTASTFSTSTSGGTSGGSYFDPSDGFASPDWFDDSVDVYTVQNATRSELESAIQASGPRLVVFETSGTIDLGGSELEITNDQCWIAGQTAPSPGITLTQGLFQVNANDCVVQHIRSRVGPGDSGDIQGNDSFNTEDQTTNNIFDHCTASWGVDECMSIGYNTDNTTFTNCLIYEGLYDPYGDGSDHNYCTLVGDGADHVAILGTVWAKARSRIPRLKGGTRSVVANNLTYFFDEGGLSDSSTVTTFEGNAYLGTNATDDYVLEDGDAYLADNTAYDPPLDSDQPFASSTELSSRPLWPSGLSTMSSGDVESHNLNYAGARPADRTGNDSRIVTEIQNRAGNDRLDSPYDYWIADHEDVGGYPQLPENTHTLSVPDSGLRDWIDQWALAVEEEDVTAPSA